MNFKRIFVSILNNINRKLFPVKWYNLKSLKPMSDSFGYDRGLPIDRFYIEKFIGDNRKLIRGKILEIGDNYYTQKYGLNILKSDILTYNKKDKRDNIIIGDLTIHNKLEKEFYDCIILTQTLNFIYDFRSAIKGIHQLLKKGGSVIVTTSGISQISEYDRKNWGDFWRFTQQGLENSFKEEFNEKQIKTISFGNVLSSISYLHGISADELNVEELNFRDNNYPLLIGLIAKK